MIHRATPLFWHQKKSFHNDGGNEYQISKLPPSLTSSYPTLSNVIGVPVAIFAFFRPPIAELHTSFQSTAALGGKVASSAAECQFDLKGRRLVSGAPPSHHSLPVSPQSSIQPQLNAYTPQTLTLQLPLRNKLFSWIFDERPRDYHDSS